MTNQTVIICTNGVRNSTKAYTVQEGQKKLNFTTRQKIKNKERLSHFKNNPLSSYCDGMK